MRHLALLLALIVVAGGCSHLDFDLSSDQPEWGESHIEGQSTRSELRLRRLARALAEWERQGSPRSTEYLIGPADVLEVSIFSLKAPGEVTALRRSVSRSGHITMPWVGSVPASGLSVPQLEDAVRAAYAGRYLKEPQVAASIIEYRSVPVVVTGAVGKPGIYHLAANHSSVLECLALAGGLAQNAGDELLIVPGGVGAAGQVGTTDVAPTALKHETIPVDLTELVDRGNLLLNLPVHSADVLIVPARPRRYVYVLGYVQRPGAYELREEDRVDALRAVAFGGGLSGIARASRSFVLRADGDEQVTIPVNLKELARGELPPLYLRPGDTLVVGTTWMGRISEFVAPSMGASVSATASAAP